MDDFLNPVSPRHPNQQFADNAKPAPPVDLDDDFEEGSEPIPLPSLGVFYQPPYFCAKELHCRPLDFRDEDILTTKRFIDEGTVFDKVVSAVIQNKGMTAYKLVPVDRDTILIWLRTMAFGSNMNIDYSCPMCRAQNSATWDLSKLDIPEYPEGIFEELAQRGERRIQLPISNLVVYVKVPTIEESRDTEKKYTKKKETEKLENDLLGTASLSLIVSGIEVEEGKIVRRKDDIMKHFKKIRLSLADSRYIRTKANEINLKYNTAQDLKCGSCGYVQEGVEMPIVHQNFLWLESGS